MNFDYKLEPGKELNIINYKYDKPIISVIIPFYNDGKYIKQTVNSVLNQTFPNFEILIIDDGSKEKESLEILKEIQKIDKRIKVFHKSNSGLASTRDYGASVSSKETKYYYFLDSDDLIEPTHFETLYWALETNKDAGWAYSDSVGFEFLNYTWNKWLNTEKLKKENILLSTSMVKKEAYSSINGYFVKEKAIFEDWNFWLRLLAKGYYPVHVSYYGIWYRRKNTGSELARAKENQKRALQLINDSASKIKKKLYPIQFPKYDYNYELIDDNIDDLILSKKEKDNKKNILMIFPWMVTGGADIFNLELIKRMDKEKYNIIVLTTLPSENNYRQEFEKYSTVYDLTSFLSQKNWLKFINYIIYKENIDLVFNSNSIYGYSVLPYIKAKYNIPIIDYVHMEEWYFRNGGYARMTGAYKDVIDKTLVCNNETKNILINHFKKSKKKIDTVYIGVDSDKFDPNKFNKDKLLSKYNINKNGRFIISYICRIANQKRPLLLAEIIKKVSKKRNDVLFIVAGDGEYLSILKNKIKKDNLDKYVVFTGNVQNTAEIYAISDMTINCSIKEGLALTSYESLSMNVPIVSADVGGQKELINDEVGVIVPCIQKEEDINVFKYSDEEINNYVEAIDKVLDNLPYYQKNCRKRVLDKFSLEKMAINMQKVFEEYLNNEINSENSLKDYINITKEIVSNEILNNKNEYIYGIRNYQKKIYGSPYTDVKGIQFERKRLDDFKDKMWKNKLWRKLVSSSIWKKIKGVIKK